MGPLFPHDCSQLRLDDALSGKGACNALNWQWKMCRLSGGGWLIHDLPPYLTGFLKRGIRPETRK